MKVLECSSKGDRRFSAMHARVTVFGIDDTIENHYQGCKRFKSTPRRAKGQKPDFIMLSGIKLDIRFLTPWYKLLWIKYLDNNPELVAYAKEFDDYSDMFKGKQTVNCQADVIREYIRDKTALAGSCKELLNILQEKRDYEMYLSGICTRCHKDEINTDR